jgi:hypothetical protein
MSLLGAGERAIVPKRAVLTAGSHQPERPRKADAKAVWPQMLGAGRQMFRLKSCLPTPNATLSDR